MINRYARNRDKEFDQQFTMSEDHIMTLFDISWNLYLSALTPAARYEGSLLAKRTGAATTTTQK